MSSTNAARWLWLSVIGFFSSYAFVFSEWLFFATKSSFLGSYSPIVSATITLLAGGALAVIIVVPIGVLAVIDAVCSRIRPVKFFVLAATLFPAAVLAVLGLLLVDNFTYTVIGFGVVSTEGWTRGIYAGAFLVLFGCLAAKILSSTGSPVRPASTIRFPGFFALTLAAFSLAAALWKFDYRPSTRAPDGVDGGLPDIILIGSDGVNAANMSLYGYERDTTPFLREHQSSMLLAENAFSNASHTTHSIISILTGKPTLTSELNGTDAFRHLPGILRNVGYFTVEFGVDEYVDAYSMNFQNGFDVVNGRSAYESEAIRRAQELGFGESAYFLSVVAGRVSDRLLHIFFMRRMVNVYEQVTETNVQVHVDDQSKIDQLLDIMADRSQPVFAHVHLMGTHGPKFAPSQRVFSGTQTQDRQWMTDFYDDAVGDFDSLLRELFESLSRSGDLGRTIIIVYTDHNMLYRSDQRVPLFFFFPGGDFSGVLHHNAQNIDIAPTVLDYLGLDRPEWMMGLSLLAGEPPLHRLIFSSISEEDIRIVDCDRWYRFYGVQGIWFTGRIAGYSGSCGMSEIASAANLPAEIAEYLHGQGIVLEDAPDSEEVYADFVGLISRVTLAQALLRAKYGPGFAPPPATGIFSDVPASDPQASWIEWAYREEIMPACADSPPAFCPLDIVNRGETAVYLLKAVEGSEYVPPPASGLFADVPVSSVFAPWIEELFARGITNGCSTDPLCYCPDKNLMGNALGFFIIRAFHPQ